MLPKIEDSRRILIVKLSSIGDVVMTTPVAKALRNTFPDSYIAWAVDDKSKDVVVGNPYVDEVIVWNRRSNSNSRLGRTVGFLSGLAELGPKLRARRFDVAIDFQGLFRSALVTRLCGARCRVGYDNAREGATMFYDMHLPSRQLRVRGPQQYLNMLQVLDIFSEDLDMYMPIGEDDRAFAQGFIAHAAPDGASRNKQVAALCPATTWPQKHWAEEGWAHLADVLASEHDALPVFLGSPADIGLVDRILGLMSGRAINAAGKTTLKQAAAIIEQSQVTIAVDTGLMHIALALDRPTVGIFGPTRWRHLTGKETFAAVVKEFPCMPCMRHPTCKRFECMKAIHPEDVLAAASRLLKWKSNE